MVMTFFNRYIDVFEDAECRNPISSIKKADFVSAGTVSDKIVVYAKNISGFDLVNMDFFTDDSDLSIEPHKIQMLESGKVISLTIIWKPNALRETALNAIISYRANVVKRA
jgi:hypothetical protein